MPRKNRATQIAALAISLLFASGCSASAPWGPALKPPPLTAVPIATFIAQTPSPSTPVPTPQMVLSTPTTITFALPAVQEPPEIEQTLRAMVGFQIQLYNLARGNLVAEDLVWMVQRATELMAETYLLIGRMTLPQREQALAEEGWFISGMLDVLIAFNKGSEGLGPTIAIGVEPETSQGKPITLTAATISTSRYPSPTMVLVEDIRQINDQIGLLSVGKPTIDDIITLFTSIQSVQTTIYQLAPSLSISELQLLILNLSTAMAGMADLIKTFVAQQA